MAAETISKGRGAAATADLLVRIDHVNAGGRRDRRTSRRVAIKRDCKVILIGQSHLPEVPVTLHDMSIGGVGMFSKRPIPPGTPIVLPLHVAGDASKLLLCDVKTCRYSHGGLYFVGAEFVQSYPDAQREGKVPRMWIRHVGGRESEV